MDTFNVSGRTAQPTKTPARAYQGQPDEQGQSINAPKVLTPIEAAALLQISTKTLLKMAAANQVPAFCAGRLWRFPAAGLEQWLASFNHCCPEAA